MLFSKVEAISKNLTIDFRNGGHSAEKIEPNSRYWTLFLRYLFFSGKWKSFLKSGSNMLELKPFSGKWKCFPEYSKSFSKKWTKFSENSGHSLAEKKSKI